MRVKIGNQSIDTFPLDDHNKFISVHLAIFIKIVFWEYQNTYKLGT